MYRKWSLMLLMTALFCACGNNFLFCNFFTEFEIKDNYFYIEENKRLQQIIKITHAQPLSIGSEKIIFVLFYKQENRKYLDFSSLEHLAQEMAQYVAQNKNIVLQIVPLEYEKETYMGRQLYHNAANQLAMYLIDNKLLTQENQKLILYTVSDSMDSVALATQNKEQNKKLDKILPKNAIHTILSLDAEASVIPNFDKIEHRLYGFYVPLSGWRGISLWKQFFKPKTGREKLFDHKRLFAKAVNIRCLYEKVTEEEPKIKKVMEASFYELFTPESNRSLARLIASIDKTYHLNNDLAAVLFSNRQGHWEEKLPLVFVNNILELLGLEEDYLEIILKNKEKKYRWSIADEQEDVCKERLKEEAVANFEAVRILYDYVDVTREKNPTLFGILVDHEKKYGTFYRKTFKGVLQTLGIRYTPYQPKKNIIGPFFIPIKEELYIVVLAKEGIAGGIQIKIGNWTLPVGFDFKLPLKYGYVVLKKKVTDFGGVSYEITPVNIIEDIQQEIKGKIPEFRDVAPNESYSFFVYGDLRKHDRSKLHKKVKDTIEQTSVAYKTKEILKFKRGALHLLTGDLIVDGSSPHDWAEFLDVVLHPLTQDKLVISAVGNHDITSSMGVGLSIYRYFFKPAVPHFGNIFYFTKTAGLEKIPATEHVAKTQNWFDVGTVRFIHLPLPTEETKGHYEEVRHSKLDTIRAGLAGMTCCNFDKSVWQAFKSAAESAHEAKKKGAIKFIVVYGHAPLVTAPEYKMHHTGIFNFMIERRGKEKELTGKDSDKYWFALELAQIFKNYAIDAYFCGHNHLYDRCDWKTKDGLSIPMVTMGVGTGLHGLHKPKKINKKLLEKITSRRLIFKEKGKAEFIGFLECTVLPSENAIVCDLLGKVGEKGRVKFLGDEPTKTNVFDTFTIRARVAR